MADKLWQATGFKKIAPKQGLDKVGSLPSSSTTVADGHEIGLARVPINRSAN
jgi:hypothetical protein